VEHAVEDVVLLPGVQVDSEAESLGTVVVGQAATRASRLRRIDASTAAIAL
jgi:hypothetical protein